jgi:hypothetical protein
LTLSSVRRIVGVEKIQGLNTKGEVKMRNTQETINENLTSQDTETFITKKTWTTPELRILPVPAKTQGGPFKGNDQDDGFYAVS